uniref:Peptidase S1 domain-containing protein n=1 Tax=Megaselia scalaris TaxID=36166 RepID=T1GQ14_MEGSC
MFKLLVLTAVLALASAGTIQFPDGKIVGGVETTIEQHPYQVSIQMNGRHFCGGSLYKNNIVVTAAHCLQGFFKVQELTVRVGSTLHKEGGQVIDVVAYKNHPEYNSYNDNNDIAVMKLKNNAILSSSVRTIELATSTPKTGTTAVVTGWGKKKSNAIFSPKELREVIVKVVSHEECASTKYRYRDRINETMMCAVGDGKDACQGDSGGPLVSGNKWSVLSHGESDAVKMDTQESTLMLLGTTAGLLRLSTEFK